jgi:hypothetical protein
MPDINWGGDSSTAPFSSRLDEANGDLILAEDNSGGTVLLEYDGTTWQYRGPVEMNGEDISGVGTLTATGATISGTVDAGAVETDKVNSRSYIAASDDAQSIIEAGTTGDIYMLQSGATWDYVPPFDIPAGVSIHGLGNSSEYTPRGDNMAVFQKAGDGRVTLNRGVTIGRGVAFDGNKANYTGDGLYVTGDKERISLDTVITNMAGDGLVTESMYDANLHNTVISNCNGYGIKFSGAGSSHNSQIVSGQMWIANNGGSGIYSDDGRLHTFRLGGTISGNGGPGIEIQNDWNDGGSMFHGSIVGNDGPAYYQSTNGSIKPLFLPARISGNGTNVTITADSTVGDVHIDAGGGVIVCQGTSFEAPGADITDVIVNAGGSFVSVISAADVGAGYGSNAELTGTGRLGITSLNNTFTNGNTDAGVEGISINPFGESITKISDGTSI